MNAEWQDLQDIFEEALSLDDENARRALLDRRCGGSQALRAEAERLLRAAALERAANAQTHPANAGRRFGVWETVRLLGRGGMGEVWLARRADGQHEQQAALKILLPYLAGPELASRFNRERQMLALLEHPNVARLLDGGSSSAGEPYLVMEYVEGTRIDRYCARERLPLEARLRLMIKVCSGISAAHQRLIIHRDLKPSNVLVTAEGEPKLLDFGIAKMIDPDAALQQTASANVFFTPLYASPEVLLGQPATVASDVYLLGLLLYELLCGRKPFEGERLSPAALVEAVTKVDPPLPSVAAGASEPHPDALAPALLRGDLDSIVLKALNKRPEERYAGALDLAADLERHLAGEPVLAVRPTRWYIARKFVHRNSVAVIAAAIVVTSLVAGLAGTLWQAHVARAERASAEARFNDARGLARYLLFDLYDAETRVPGTMPLQADMARRSLEYLDRMARIRTGDPGLRLELARGYLKLGEVFGRRLNGLGDTLGGVAKAIESDRKALALAEPLARERPGDWETQRALASAEQQLGSDLSVNAQYAEAFQWLSRAANDFERIAAAHPRDVGSLRDAGLAWQTYGKQLSEKGGYANFNASEARGYLDRSVKDLEAALRIAPNDAAAIKLLGATYESIGRIESTPNPAQGIEAYRAALAVLARLPAEDAGDGEVRERRAMMLAHIGWDQGQLGQFKAAIASIEEAGPIVDEVAAADTSNIANDFRRVDVYRSLGIVYGYAGDKAKSLVNLRKCVEILDGLVKRDPLNTLYASIHAELQGRVANLLVETGRPAAARPYAAASIAYYRRVAESPTATPSQLMEAVRATAETEIADLRDYPSALRFALRADELAKGKNAAVLGYLAEAYGYNGKYAEAVDAAKRGLALTPAVKAGEPPSRLQGWLDEQIKENEKKALGGSKP